MDSAESLSAANHAIGPPSPSGTSTPEATPMTPRRDARYRFLPLVGALLLGCDATSPSAGPPLVWAQLDAGSAATCGVTLVGDGYCWGDAWATGGSDTSPPVLLPNRLAGHQWRMIEVGGTIACGLTVAQETICWGPSWNFPHREPSQIKGDQHFATITVGDTHACGLTAAGVAACWGDNARGQLGLGWPDYLTSPRDSAVAPVGGHAYLVLRAGTESTCGLVANGDLLCWGGSEVEGDGFTPHVVQSGFGFTTLGFGGNPGGRGQSCAIGADSTLYCFGYEVHSLLPQPTPTAVTLPAGGEPVQVAVGGIWQPLVGLPYEYDLHHCAVTTTAAVFCWGSNNYGQLGDSSTVDRTMPAVVTGLTDIASVTTGGIHSCALTHQGTAYCWGWNGRGQLGIGSDADHVTTPKRVLSAP